MAIDDLSLMSRDVGIGSITQGGASMIIFCISSIVTGVNVNCSFEEQVVSQDSTGASQTIRILGKIAIFVR